MAREQITRKMVERQFELFCKSVPAPEGRKWALEYNAPGGGVAYFKLGLTGTDGHDRFISYNGPLGGNAWSGARAAFDGLHAMWRLADYLKTLRPELVGCIDCREWAARKLKGGRTDCSSELHCTHCGADGITVLQAIIDGR